MGSHILSIVLVFILVCGKHFHHFPTLGSGLTAVTTWSQQTSKSTPEKRLTVIRPTTGGAIAKVINRSETRGNSSNTNTKLTFTMERKRNNISQETKEAWRSTGGVSTTFEQQTANGILRTLHLSTCLSGRRDFLFPGVGVSHLRFVSDRLHLKKRFEYCVGSLRVPVEKFISLAINSFEMSAKCHDLYVSGTRLTINRNIDVRPCERYVVFHSGQNKVEYNFTLFHRAPPFNITLTITAQNTDQRKHLNVSYHTRLSGIIIPYGFNGVTDYAVNMLAEGFLFPLPGHSVMISFPHFQIRHSRRCRSDFLSLIVNGSLVWSRCGYYQMPPVMYHAYLKLLFVSRSSSRKYSGFKSRFSFHKASELPDKLLTTNDNLAIFNCSVFFYLNFKQHLECNLNTECVNAEDEISCSYSQGACGSGLFIAGGRCYKYIKVMYKAMTWYDASTICLKQGLTLISFPTSRHEDEFRDEILRFAFTAKDMFVGLRTSDISLPTMYRDVCQWSSGIMAYYQNLNIDVFKPTCTTIYIMLRNEMYAEICGRKDHMHFIFCEEAAPVKKNASRKINLPRLDANYTFGVNENTLFVKCPGSHVTHDFLSCEHGSQCGGEIGAKVCVTSSSMRSGKAERSVEVLMYVCDSQTQTIHYTELCDFVAQCAESSDESFCVHQACSEKRCLNGQCVTTAQWCDGMAHCYDSSDEVCPQFVTGSPEQSIASTARFHVVLFDGYGKYRYVPRGKEFPVCPVTHFLCRNRELCLPVYLRCNSVDDCPYREDEDKCDDIACPGYYRCRESSVCVHADHVCDGEFQCPQQDDELLCQLVCPDNCLCQGLAFVCPRSFPARAYSEIRYLDASQSGLTPNLLFHNQYLVRLALADCGLNTLPVLIFPNLKFLDLSKNILMNVNVNAFLKLSNIHFISLSENPLVDFTISESNAVLENVHSLDLSHTKLGYFESENFSNVRHLKDLNLSYSLLKVISSNGFGSLAQIESLDLRGTELEDYPDNMLQPLSSLRVLFSEVFKLCCPDILPEQFNIQNCHTSPDEISSCKDLLRSEIYRMFLWTSCTFALIGNAGSFAAKVYMQRGKPPSSFSVFISNLNIADLFMGLYLAVLGCTDQKYRGRYLWHDKEWKTSTVCKTAGFMSLLSCEVSAFIICFITLDRILVMRFPFSQLRFRNTSAQVVCVLIWVTGVALASVPLLPMTSQWEFYSQTDICIPLPVTRQNFKGRHYSFGILIVLNFILFVFIAVGQLSIYISVRANSMTTDQKNAREATVARRLLNVVMSDFLCWFPIGLLGLLASKGVSIPGEVNVAMAIFTLPLNSALNLFLYTFNLIMEKRQKASEERLLKVLQTRISGCKGHSCVSEQGKLF